MRRVTMVLAVLVLAGCGSGVENAHKAVAQLLDNPKSAKFTNARVTQQGNVCGQVKGKDASGVYGGFQSYAAIKTTNGYRAILDPEGNNPEVRAACGGAPAGAEAQAPAESSVGPWDVQIVPGGNMGAISDMSSRLVEHGFKVDVVTRNGVAQVLLGPFNSRAEADEKRAQLMSTQGIESTVITHQPAP